MDHADGAAAVNSARGIGLRSGQHAKWRWLRWGLTLVFFVAVAGLLLRLGGNVEWTAVWRGAQANTPATLLLAALLATISHGLVSSFDLLGRHVTGHGLPVARVGLIAWVSYAFNLNLGALVGGAGFRWRLYSRQGLENTVIAQVYGLSVITNWLAYLVLLGAVLLFWPIALPDDWQLGRHGLTVMGVVAPSIAVAYLLACALAPRKHWQWRGHGFDLPSGRVAIVQLLLSATNWLVIGTLIHALLGRQVDFALVLGVTLLAAVAGAITHVPAGLGVLEAVFVALLAHVLPQNEVLAALLTYRALYYLGPLVLAVVAFAIMEFGWRRVTRAERAQLRAAPGSANHGQSRRPAGGAS